MHSSTRKCEKGQSVTPPVPFSSHAPTGAILSLGTDEHLLQSRAHILRLTGGEVTSVLPDKAEAALLQYRFHLAVFGHTLSDSQTAELAQVARQVSPETRLLLTCFRPRPAAIRKMFDAEVESWKGPTALIGEASRLLALDARTLPDGTERPASF